jgi:RNA polymerase sigma factor (sigma-70 family)
MQRFATTRWSIVVQAGRQSSPDCQHAMATLCEAYWYPIYAFVRRHGHSVPDAQDLTQEFFARLLERNDLSTADQGRGRFRSFLLAAVKHFLCNERDRARAKKRGGGRGTLSLDFGAGEERLGREPINMDTPEKLFERRWALTMLENVLSRLRAEYDVQGRQTLFAALKGALAGEKSPRGYGALANELKMTEGAVKVAVHRLRRRYRELLHDEVAQTVTDRAKIDHEIRELFAALGA